MSHSKRISAPKDGLPSLQDGSIDDEDALFCDIDTGDNDSSVTTAFVPQLSHLTEGCSVRDIDPSACVPLHLMRKKSANAVKRLKLILNGDASSEGSDVFLTGMISGPPTSIVVPLVGDLEILLDVFLAEKYQDEEDGKVEKAMHETWYGIIDGCHVYRAIMELRSELPRRWGTFKWKVCTVQPGYQSSDYRKLAIAQNERNKQAYHFETTLYDLLFNLRRIHDDLHAKHAKGSRVTVNVFHKDVAQEYDGGSHEKNTTVRQAVSVASRLSSSTIEAIGFVANATCPGIVLHNGKLNTQNLKTQEAILSRYDCRLFKKILCTSTLRGARHFMNALNEGQKDAQVNTIYRARHWSERNDFQSIKPVILNRLYGLSKQALVEEIKFLKFIGESIWPTGMETNKENLLRSTAYDEDLEGNKGNDTDVLPELWKCFCRKYPGKARGIQLMKKKVESEATAAALNEDPPPPNPSDSTVDDNGQSEESAKRAEDEKRRLEEERHALMRVQADKYLMENGIITHDMCFEAFAKDISADSFSRVDLVLTSVPSEVTSHILEKLPAFCKDVLKTGSYVFLVVNELQLSTMQNSFRAAGFKVCDHAFSIIYETKTMRKRKILDFPQRHIDFALIAKTHGIHPDGFVPDFASSAFSEEGEHSPSTFASLSNVPNCENKLKQPNRNTALFPDEKNVELFSKVIRLLTPLDGTLVDPFAGPLTCSIACLDTGRGCVAMDQASDKLTYAIGRLRVYATPNETMANHEVYTGTLKGDLLKEDSAGVEKKVTEDESFNEKAQRKKLRTNLVDTRSTSPLDDHTSLETTMRENSIGVTHDQLDCDADASTAPVEISDLNLGTALHRAPSDTPESLSKELDGADALLSMKKAT